jgi:hypothetical protein
MALCHLKANEVAPALAHCTALLHAASPAPTSRGHSEGGRVPSASVSSSVVHRALVLRARALRRGGRPAEARGDLDRADRVAALLQGGAQGALAGGECDESVAVAAALRAALSAEKGTPGSAPGKAAVAAGSAALLRDSDLPPSLPASFEADMEALLVVEAAARARQALPRQALPSSSFGGGGDLGGLGSLLGSMMGPSMMGPSGDVASFLASLMAPGGAQNISSFASSTTSVVRARQPLLGVCVSPAHFLLSTHCGSFPLPTRPAAASFLLPQALGRRRS